MSRIPLFDYLGQYERIRDEIHEAVERVLRSNRLVLGPEVERFEKDFAAYLGGGSCVGVNSGTDALAVALMALGVGAGDEVVTVSNTAVPTVSAIRMVGALPVFCDVDANTALMDLDQLPSLLSARTRAVIPVHLFGNVVDVPRIMEMVADRRVGVIEDCAQAHGAMLRGRMAGTMGHASAFSFYPTKNLGAYGDAGICHSNDESLVREMRRIRVYGFEGQYYSEREGVNTRLDELQAAILNVKLRHLPDWLARRREWSVRYDQCLGMRFEKIMPGEGVLHARHLYVIKTSRRDEVRRELEHRGIVTGIHYPTPIHRMRGYAFLNMPAGSLPRTEALAGSILSLPLYPELGSEAVERVCAALNETLTA